jgi:thioredoxin 1
MSKFGALIDAQLPVLLDFYTDWNEASVAMHPVLRDVAAALGDDAKVVKIDVDKNPELANALHIKTVPTFIIYHKGEMCWRQSGAQDANTLIGLVHKYAKVL